MVILVDTNVLLRAAKQDGSDNSIARRSLAMLHDAGHVAAIVPQSIYEYYVVATRPIESNGLGIRPGSAMLGIDELLTIFRLYRDERGVFDEWRALVARFPIVGKSAHDARIVAAMKRHGLSILLTFNVGDFTRYEADIEVLNPREVASGIVRF